MRISFSFALCNALDWESSNLFGTKGLEVVNIETEESTYCQEVCIVVWNEIIAFNCLEDYWIENCVLGTHRNNYCHQTSDIIDFAVAINFIVSFISI